MARVPDRNGLSLLYTMLEIHHSGREPSNYLTTRPLRWSSTQNYRTASLHSKFRILIYQKSYHYSHSKLRILIFQKKVVRTLIYQKSYNFLSLSSIKYIIFLYCKLRILICQKVLRILIYQNQTSYHFSHVSLGFLYIKKVLKILIYQKSYHFSHCKLRILICQKVLRILIYQKSYYFSHCKLMILIYQKSYQLTTQRIKNQNHLSQNHTFFVFAVICFRLQRKKVCLSVGLVRPGFGSRLCHGDFSESSHTSDVKISTPVSTLPDA